MARINTGIDPAAAIPVADVLDQQLVAAIEPLGDTPEEHPQIEAEPAADDADRCEQLLALPTDDEEAYPNAHLSSWDGWDA